MTDPSATFVRYAVAEGVATITLARPEAANAMSWDLVDQFARAVAATTGDPATRAILIEAEGKHFSVGGDIRAFASEPEPAAFIGRLARRLHEGVTALAACPAPVIVAAQGAAAGAGLSVVAGGDIVLAGRSASFAMAYTGIGLTADGGATWFLPRLIGLRRTQELAYTGRRLTADEALSFGLVTRLVDDAALADEARALARQVAAGPTAAYGGVKRLLAETDRAPLPAQLDAEADAIELAMAGEDAREGIAAFLARRPAAYRGC
jgi:2-(1,2-epoxy-1,2-dihydrophenyl)acetyl-CoA isomerase